MTEFRIQEIPLLPIEMSQSFSSCETSWSEPLSLLGYMYVVKRGILSASKLLCPDDCVPSL